MEKNNARNFVIISHIDHGKSTLADRLLEMTGTISQDKMKEQFLDSMALEREKGITIKMHPVRLNYQTGGNNYIFNLIDTPGHIDFSYEISRALACVEGALLLVDAAKGIQAQTLHNLSQAQKQGLVIIGAVNKIDLPQARVAETRQELAEVLNVDPEEVFLISGKTGQNVDKVLQAVIEKVPCPVISDINKPLKALVFDSQYDPFSGVVVFVRIFEGTITAGDKINFVRANYQCESKEVGYFIPQLITAPFLGPGDIGYIKTGIKVPSKVKVGETITGIADIGYRYGAVEPLTGYQEPQPVLYLSLFPYNADDFDHLKDSLEKLRLSDPALIFSTDSKMALGRGFKVGFLGSLHAEITVRRLKADFDLDLVTTAPQVIFKVVTKNSQTLMVSSPSLWPEETTIQQASEPWVNLEIITPNHYIGSLFPILQNFDIALQETKFLTPQKSILIAQAPLREIISGDLYDKMKTITEGYGSFSFEQTDYQVNDLVKLDILIANEPCDPFSRIVPRGKAYEISRKFLLKLKDVLPSQQFLVSLQAMVGGKIIARESISARRKDVTAPLYGGDVTRKRKLLDIQKKGKKELQSKGQVRIPSKVFLEMLKD
ncbi:MAG: translation elongation factor 4 [Patescibacteria group bacterium]